MNEELQKALAEFIKTVLLGLQQGKDFVLAQAPEVIQQLIRWHFWQAVCSIPLDLLPILLAYKCIPPLAKRWTNEHDPILEGIGICILAALVVLGVVFALSDIATALQIYVAPKVWLLEWAISQTHQPR